MASKNSASAAKCLCSPTTHPGSFRCNLHRDRGNIKKVSSNLPLHFSQSKSCRESKSKTNLCKEFLMQIMIKPSRSSQSLQRRNNFQPSPSRFGLKNSNGDGDGMAISWWFHCFHYTKIQHFVIWTCKSWYFSS